MNTISLSLPWPVSANRYWRTVVNKKTGRAMTFVSKEAESFKTEVAWLASMAGIRKPLLGRVAISYTLYPKRPQDWEKRQRQNPEGWDDTVQSIDLDNAQKVLLDALKNVVFEDDKFVWEIHARRGEPTGNARVEVTITPLAAERVQGTLL